GEALLEFFPCGGEGVDEPGGDEVAFVEGVSGWAVADCPGGGAWLELGVGGGGGVGDGYCDGVEEAGGLHVVVSLAEWVEGGEVGWVMDFLMGSRRPAVFIWWCRQQRGWRLGSSVVPPVSGWVWWYSWMWSIWLAQEVGRVQPGTAQTGKVRRRYSSISGVGTYRSAGRGRNAPVVGSVRTR